MYLNTKINFKGERPFTPLVVKLLYVSKDIIRLIDKPAITSYNSKEAVKANHKTNMINHVKINLLIFDILEPIPCVFFSTKLNIYIYLYVSSNIYTCV